MTLLNASKQFLVYLSALRVSHETYRNCVFALKDILVFYGYDFPLRQMNGGEILRYADEHDPWDWIPEDRKKAQVFWKFIHWLKRNEMIPAWAEKQTE